MCLSSQVGAVVMARSGRPASESYQPACYSGSQSVSFSSEAGIVGLGDEDECAPIFSLSKSSMDVVMAPLHKRDPAWARMDLRRSASTDTHAEQISVTLQQRHPNMWQHVNATNSHRLSLTAKNLDMQNPPALSERWIANMERWSGCSGSTHSRSSTPETVVWKDGLSRPSSLTQEAPCSAAPDSPMSKLTSPPTTPSPFISPLQTPTLPPEDLLTSSSSSATLSAHQQKDLLVSSPTPSPLQANTSSPSPSDSPDLLQLTSAKDEGILENNLPSFTFPSAIPSSVSLAEAVVASDGCLADDVTEELHSPSGSQLSEGGGVRSPVLSDLMPNSPAEEQESGRAASGCHLELTWQTGQSCPTGQSPRSPLVSSMSDSGLGECCRCNLNTRECITKAPRFRVFREEGTMTSKPELVDVAVQTISSIDSWWGLGENVSTSNMDSHSILGSPPGSKLNLKSSVGSNSNLVSPSSSMFPVSSGEEEEKREDGGTWEVNSASSHDMERRRSCLKIQGEERDERGRRSSMKQVQWDEDGMTWDVHGATVDPEMLSTVIRKHLEIQNSPQPQRRTSKKKKAPKPPLLSNVVRAMAPELNPPVMIVTTCMVEGESEGTPAADGGREVGQEGGPGKKEETVAAPRRISRAEGEYVKVEDEVYGEEGIGHPKSPSRGSGHIRKRSVIRSLKRPGWCGSSRKIDN